MSSIALFVSFQKLMWLIICLLSRDHHFVKLTPY
jgi:hypothetical protein